MKWSLPKEEKLEIMAMAIKIAVHTDGDYEKVYKNMISLFCNYDPEVTNISKYDHEKEGE